MLHHLAASQTPSLAFFTPPPPSPSASQMPRFSTTKIRPSVQDSPRQLTNVNYIPVSDPFGPFFELKLGDGSGLKYGWANQCGRIFSPVAGSVLMRSRNETPVSQTACASRCRINISQNERNAKHKKTRGSVPPCAFSSPYTILRTPQTHPSHPLQL